VAVSPTPPLGTESEDFDDQETDDSGQVYCICRQVSHGEMIACDAEDCPNSDEWFHLECVGLKEVPKDWYCKDCAQKKKRKK
ncbi:hypothetical protein HK096_010220, partial [Nowakowskiella sp. JEL0078]